MSTEHQDTQTREAQTVENVKITIQHVWSENADEFVDLISPLFKKFGSHYTFHNTIEQIRPFLLKRLKGEGSHIFLAFIHTETLDATTGEAVTTSTPAGFAQIYSHVISAYLEENWNLSDLYVYKKYRMFAISQSCSTSSFPFNVILLFLSNNMVYIIAEQYFLSLLLQIFQILGSPLTFTRLTQNRSKTHPIRH